MVELGQPRENIGLNWVCYVHGMFVVEALLRPVILSRPHRVTTRNEGLAPANEAGCGRWGASTHRAAPVEVEEGNLLYEYAPFGCACIVPFLRR